MLPVDTLSHGSSGRQFDPPRRGHGRDWVPEISRARRRPRAGPPCLRHFAVGDALLVGGLVAQALLARLRGGEHAGCGVLTPLAVTGPSAPPASRTPRRTSRKPPGGEAIRRLRTESRRRDRPLAARPIRRRHSGRHHRYVAARERRLGRARSRRPPTRRPPRSGRYPESVSSPRKRSTTTSVVYFSCPDWSVHLRVCSEPST